MERNLDRLDDRLKSLTRALRLRGVWEADAPDAHPDEADEPERPVHRLRRAPTAIG